MFVRFGILLVTDLTSSSYHADLHSMYLDIGNVGFELEFLYEFSHEALYLSSLTQDIIYKLNDIFKLPAV